MNFFMFIFNICYYIQYSFFDEASSQDERHHAFKSMKSFYKDLETIENLRESPSRIAIRENVEKVMSKHLTRAVREIMDIIRK